MSLKIVNMVITNNLECAINFNEISRIPLNKYPFKIFRGSLTHYKQKEMKGNVAIFKTGLLISTGTRHVADAEKDIDYTIQFLNLNLKENFVKKKSKMVNVVAVLTLPTKVDLDLLASLEDVFYEPDQFSGAIMKNKNPKSTFLIFSSGKVVITGINSEINLRKASDFVINYLQKYSYQE